jgi:hypothetical protein
MLVLLLLASTVAASDAEVRAKIGRAKAAIDSGSVDLERDIRPAIDMLRKSKDDDDQRRLVDDIVDLGRHDGSSPAAVKKYIKDEMTPILLGLAANKSNSTFLRGDSIHGLRDMGASRAALEEVTRMALADADGYVHSRGEILENYIKSMPAGAHEDAARPVDAAQERDAIAFLKSRRLGVSADQLERSAMEAKPEEVKALLAAGVAVDGEGDDTPLIAAMRACSGGETAELVETVELLLAAGADVKRLDDNKNTPLISAAQYCGEKVVSRLVAAGADVNIVNGSGMTPLMIAVFNSRFEAADALVAKGARLTKEQADIAAQMPDPRAKAIAQKASAPKKSTAKKK